MVALQDESTQRNGIVHICMGNPNHYLNKVAMNAHMIHIPSRPVAYHLCLFERTMSRLIKPVLIALGKQIRVRLRIHLFIRIN